MSMSTEASGGQSASARRPGETGAMRPDAPQNLNRQGSVVASMTLISRISGVVRDMALAHFFGATAVADAFFVAFRIPNYFRRLSAEGAFSQAFIPVLAEFKARGDRSELIRFVRVMSGHFVLALTLLSLLGIAGAQWLVAVFAPGFSGDSERAVLATEMLRITFPYIAFISLVAFAGAVLNSHQRFAIPAFTPIVLNLTLIVSALWAAPAFSQPVMALAWGVLAAGLLQFLFQLPALGRIDMLYAPRFERRHEGVQRVGRLMLPAIFAASVSQFNALIDTVLASFLVTGSISWLYYSDRLMELPVGLVAVAIATVLLPSLSRLHATGAREAFSRSLDWGLRIGLLFGAPAACALYLLAIPLIATIFHRGAMTELDTAMAALALQAFAVGLVGIVIAKIAAPAYFARQDTVTPFRIALISISVNLVFNLLLIRWLGHVGLALATSIAAIVQAWLLLRGLLRAGIYRPGRALYGFIIRVTVAIALMALAIVWYLPAELNWVEMREIERVWRLAVTCLLGVTVYFATLFALGMRLGELRHRA
jgi:putative peptidoglycan lipid II flippase